MILPIHFFTIVLDGMPFITFHYPTFRKLSCEWTWTIMEGVASPTGCTSWCRKIKPRLSVDGTTQYLKSISAQDKRIRYFTKEQWNGKLEMINHRLPETAGLIWQVDSDEVWGAGQISTMHRAFHADPSKTCAQFFCRYFVGPNLITTGRNGYGNRSFDWLRVWRYSPGMKFSSHEPPRIKGCNISKKFTQSETASMGLVFDHYAYATEASARFKGVYYGHKGGKYDNALDNWNRLQANTSFPCKLKDFFPWVEDQTGVIAI